MRNVVLLILALLLASTAGAATAPDALLSTGNGPLYLVDASGAVTAAIQGVYTGAAWSPDGSRLAYLAQDGASSRILVHDAVYDDLIKFYVHKKPYPSREGILNIISEVAKSVPKAASLKFEDVADASIIEKLDKSGFIDSLYK